MEEFVKVEKLVEITGVSYEDARAALRACDGEIVDAMVYLEKLGKVTSYRSTSEDPRFAPITEAEMEAAAAKRAESKEEVKTEKKSGGFGEFVRKVMRFLTHNKITISKGGQEFASIPLLVALIIINVSVGFAVVAVFVSMMFGYEYSFTGESDLTAANRVLAQAGGAAGHVKAEYDRL
jgi:UBA/TS-N domain.